MAEIADLLGVAAAQHVDDMGGAEALARAIDSGERLLHQLGAVDRFGRLQAGVAIAAGLLQRLAEIGQQHLAAAARGLAIADQSLELAALDLLLRFGRVRGFQELAQLGDVLQAVEHEGFGGQAVAAGPAGLLVVGFESLRRVEMDDEAHVRLVDAHAEGDRRDDHDAVILDEAVLMGRAHGLVEAGVIGQGGIAAFGQPGRGLLDLVARQAIDDAGMAGVAGLQEVFELAAAALLHGHAIADVRAVEAGDEDAALAEVQPLDDVAAGRRVGGGGEGDARHLRVTGMQDRELQIFRPEVVAPLRDAVGLVDGEERHLAAVEQVEEGVGQQPLGRDIDQIDLAGAHLPLDLHRIAEGNAGIQRRRSHVELAQRLDLIAHERDERRHHDGDARRGRAPAPGSRATCRRRSASAPARRRRPRHDR